MSDSKAITNDVFVEPTKDTVVNVASVHHLSPFRYPGGKIWLVPRVRRWLSQLRSKPRVFIEPFAGGGIIGLTAAFESLADKVVLVELDDDVAAVWQTMLGDDNDWLAERILTFDVSVETVRAEMAMMPTSRRDRAFKTLLKNRTYHGGILANGSAPMRFGENGRGIKSRWYGETLAKRIKRIAALRDKIEFVHGDGIVVIEENSKCNETVFFIDPPYTAGGKRAGSRLYTHHALDHEKLFTTAEGVNGDFLMTYDADPALRKMAESHGFQTKLISMKNTHHTVMNEMLIGRDFSWAG